MSTHPARPAPHPAVSPLRADGTRDVFFEANGVPRVVDVVDESAGTVRLKGGVADADEMALDTRSTRTVRVKK